MGVALKKPRKTAAKAGASAFNFKSVDDRGVLSMIDLVRQGVSFQEFDRISRAMPFQLSDWAKFLQVSERTIQRNQKEKKAFPQVQSERILDISMLYDYGLTVFGDKVNFNVWLNANSVALGGRKPIELLDTGLGVAMVRDELGRIEHGIFA